MLILRVPYGAISSSADFWKHVDEAALGLPTRTMLYTNGVRAGIAQVAATKSFDTVVVDVSAEIAAPGAQFNPLRYAGSRGRSHGQSRFGIALRPHPETVFPHAPSLLPRSAEIR